VTLYRPSDAHADRSVRLALDANGVQRIDIANATRGHWVVQLQWHAGERDYYRERAVQLR
jgi:nitrogen fixation protein FixH